MITLDLQIACEWDNLPSQSQFELWANSALQSLTPDAELTIRISDNQESQQLNHQYRGKNKSTNVLSFPFESPPGIELPLIGDLIICPEVVYQEAIDQDKSFHDHFAHMVIHGCLHLVGYDHITTDEADEMETIEKKLLIDLNIADPYRD